MDRRTLLALVLTAIVIVATPMIFRGPRRDQPTATDTARPPASDSAVQDRRVDTTPTIAPVAPRPTTTPPSQATRAETTLVRTQHALYRIVSPGGTPAAVTLPEHRSLRRTTDSGAVVNLLEPGDRLFRLAFANGADTVALDTVTFRAAPQRLDSGTIVQSFTSVGAVPITLTYRFPADSFVVRIDGSIGAAAGAGSRLFVTMPR